jgi:hypothetical protein|tara:strand:- start:179 stop:595 length:417 start_codon:yes stop_codon:yes gene_type:complete
MATTTATLTLTSTDLLTDSLSLSATATLFKAGTTTGLDSIQYERLEVPTGDVYDMIDATSAGANKANKIYIANKHTDATKYVDIYIAAVNIGRLYAGDWAFFPLEAAAATQDVGIEAISAAQVVEFALIHEGKTLVAS